MKKILVAIREFLSERFNLEEDKADEQIIIEHIRRNIHFRGTNLWTLIFAIFIASIGLNVNSTAVIIGAMLISPLMGPIMGVGLAIGIYDFDLLKKSLKNLFVAVFISVATSTLYFSITPLHDAGMELLARTNPSVWDVFIALVGGLAGIVAGTRKEKSNVIPGVAIATALMPPLCTAGYGIAMGNPAYFMGAFYLFFINSLFICLATFLVVRYLRFSRTELASEELERKVSRYMLIIVIVTVAPSIYLGWRIVQRSIFESNASQFVKKEFHRDRTQVVTDHAHFEGSRREIEVLLVGQPLTDSCVDSIRLRLPEYGLGGTILTVHQGQEAREKIDLSEIKSSVLQDVYALEFARDSILQKQAWRVEYPVEIGPEIKALYPTLDHYTLGTSVAIYPDTTLLTDTLPMFIGTFEKPLDKKEKERFYGWLLQRTQKDTIVMIYTE